MFIIYVYFFLPLANIHKVSNLKSCDIKEKCKGYFDPLKQLNVKAIYHHSSFPLLEAILNLFPISLISILITGIKIYLNFFPSKLKFINYGYDKCLAI